MTSESERFVQRRHDERKRIVYLSLMDNIPKNHLLFTYDRGYDDARKYFMESIIDKKLSKKEQYVELYFKLSGDYDDIPTASKEEFSMKMAYVMSMELISQDKKEFDDAHRNFASALTFYIMYLYVKKFD